MHLTRAKPLTIILHMQAGMVTTLSTRTSVLGVTNPTKGAFKHGASCSGVAATSLSGPLLSRCEGGAGQAGKARRTSGDGLVHVCNNMQHCVEQQRSPQHVGGVTGIMFAGAQGEQCFCNFSEYVALPWLWCAHMCRPSPVKPGHESVVLCKCPCAALHCRFDIVLLLLDQHEPSWDLIVSEHVLANHQQVSRAWRLTLRYPGGLVALTWVLQCLFRCMAEGREGG